MIKGVKPLSDHEGHLVSITVSDGTVSDSQSESSHEEVFDRAMQIVTGSLERRRTMGVEEKMVWTENSEKNLALGNVRLVEQNLNLAEGNQKQETVREVKFGVETEEQSVAGKELLI